MKLLRIGNKRIVLARSEQGYVAFDDRCTHRGGSLAGGVMICGAVQCLWHGSQFDVSTGKVKAGPEREYRCLSDYGGERRTEAGSLTPGQGGPTFNLFLSGRGIHPQKPR